MGKRFAAVLAGLLLAILPAAGPARAHDGKLKLQVAGDGAGGVTVRAQHADGHRLDSVVRLVLSATADGGRTVGPLQLAPAAEGQGFYSSGSVLAAGTTWRVTVTAPAPYATRTTVDVKAKVAQTAPPVVAASPVAPSRPWWPIGLGVLALAAIVAVVAVVASRRRRRAA